MSPMSMSPLHHFHHGELVLGISQTGEAVVLSGREAGKHKTIVGVTGAGKSKFLASFFVQALNQNIGCILLDPSGDLCDDILRVLASDGFFDDSRSLTRLLYLDFSCPDAFVPMNVLRQPYSAHKTAGLVLEAFKRSWASLQGGGAPVLEGLVLYGSLVLTRNQQPLTRLPTLLTNASFRAELLRHVDDDMALEFFTRFSATGGRSNLLSESTIRRVMLLAFQPSLRFVLGQADNMFLMREVMDKKVSVLVNLGGLDPETQSFLGCLIATQVEEAALSRSDIPEAKRTPYHFIMDEFSQFSSRSAVGLERVLSLTRKYGLSLTLACQVFGQIPSELRAALGQTTFIGFRLSRTDASWGAELVSTIDRERVKHTATGRPTFMSAAEQRAEWEDILTSLPTQQAVLRVGDQTIRFHTLGIAAPERSGQRLEQGVEQSLEQHLEVIKAQYRQLYLTPRAQLEPGENGQDRQDRNHLNLPNLLPRPSSEAPKSQRRVRRIVPLDEPTP